MMVYDGMLTYTLLLQNNFFFDPNFFPVELKNFFLLYSLFIGLRTIFGATGSCLWATLGSGGKLKEKSL